MFFRNRPLTPGEYRIQIIYVPMIFSWFMIPLTIVALLIDQGEGEGIIMMIFGMFICLWAFLTSFVQWKAITRQEKVLLSLPFIVLTSPILIIALVELIKL